MVRSTDKVTTAIENIILLKLLKERGTAHSEAPRGWSGGKGKAWARVLLKGRNGQGRIGRLSKFRIR